MRPRRGDAAAWRREQGHRSFSSGGMYEDRAIELEVLPAGGRVFCIASAGCTAFELAARGDEVTAIDVNPAQVRYVQRRLAGEPPVEGRVAPASPRPRLGATAWLGRP